MGRRRHGHILFAALVVGIASAASFACGESARDLGYREAEDAGPSALATPDSGTDSEVPEASPAPPCVEGQSRSAPCGVCGTRTEVCVGGSRWEATTACSSEKDCNPGDSESTTLGCAAPKRKSRACATSCAWDPWSACSLPTGWRAVSAVGMSRVNQSPVASNGRVYLPTGRPSAGVTDGLSAYDPQTDTWRFLGESAGNAFLRGFATPSGVGYVNILPTNVALTLVDGASGAETQVPAPAFWPANVSDVLVAWSATTSEVIVWLGPTSLAAFAPSTSSWRSLPPPPAGFVAPSGSASVLVVSGKIVIGGPVVVGARLLVFDLASSAWSAKTFSADGAFSDAFTVDGGRVFAKLDYRNQPAGQVGGSLMGVIHAIGAGTFSTVPAPAANVFPGRFGTHGAYASNGAKLLFWSGQSEEGSLYASGASYDIAAGKWEPMPEGGLVSGGALGSQHAWIGSELFVVESNNTRMRIYRP